MTEDWESDLRMPAASAEILLKLNVRFCMILQLTVIQFRHVSNISGYFIRYSFNRAITELCQPMAQLFCTIHLLYTSFKMLYTVNNNIFYFIPVSLE